MIPSERQSWVQEADDHPRRTTGVLNKIYQGGNIQVPNIKGCTFNTTSSTYVDEQRTKGAQNLRYLMKAKMELKGKIYDGAMDIDRT